MIFHVKIGTMSGDYVALHGDLHDPALGDDDPPPLSEPPSAGDRVSWRELENGPWCTGIVDGFSGDLVLIARH